MRDDLILDDAALRHLPLPLAQLARRAFNAQSSRDRCYNAYFLWEAALKLAGSTAIIEYIDSGDHDAQLTDRLQNLARPALGHWWEFVRRLAPVLAGRDDPGFAALCAVILGNPRNDLPRLAGLDAVLQETLGGRRGARSTVRIPELFDRLIQLRNEELGHGATGQRPVEVYDRLAPALLAGMMELFGSVDVLAGRRLLYVADVRRLANGHWLIERYELIGESPRRLESFELSPDKATSLPLPERVYLLLDDPPQENSQLESGRDDTSGVDGFRTLSLHPLLLFESDELSGKAYFLNSTRRKRQAQYLCYTTGEVVKRESLGEDHRELLSRVLGQPVRAETFGQWEAKSQAEEPLDSSSVESPPRRTLGEFELLSRIGRGGMAVVYRAWQSSLARQVALKSLMHIGDPKAQVRFSREIRALGRVEHPHLVKVYASGSDGEQWFYAMELLEGADLAGVCQRLAGASGIEVGETEWRAAVSTAWEDRRASEESLSQDSNVLSQFEQDREGAVDASDELAPPVHASASHVHLVVKLLRQVALATQALHDAGIVHRDIKPGNIMLSPDGTHAVLMDLGLAQLADDAAGRLTRTRQFVGTLRYASPEQVLAAGNLDHRSDVYSLGATLWELLTLRPLFGGNDDTPTPDLMLAIQSVDPESPRRYNQHVPKDLAAIVQHCMEKRRDQRYPTAQALADDLGRFLRGEPVSARPVTQFERSWRWCRRNPVVSTLIASVLLALVAGGVGMTYFGLNAMHALAAEREANQQKVLAQVDALLDAVPGAVPGILENLETGGEPVLNRLRELQQDSTLPVTQRHRIEMALQPTDPTVRPLLLEGLLDSDLDPAECVLIRDVLRPNSPTLAPKLWELVFDQDVAPNRQFRAAVALAHFDADNPDWADISVETVEELLSTNPLHLGLWKEALRPVADALTPALIDEFRKADPEHQQRRNVAAFVLADYAGDSVELLADLTADADERQFEVVFSMLAEHGDAAREALKRELVKSADAGALDAAKEALARRQANAAVALFRLGDIETLWPMLVHSADPRRRSLLIHRLASLGTKANPLIDRLFNNSAVPAAQAGPNLPTDERPFQDVVFFDPETSVRRALILALGEYDEMVLPPETRDQLVPRLVELYEHEPDAGMHSAAEWLLRRWGQSELIEASRSRFVEEGAAVPPASPSGAHQRNWFVNGQGQSFALVTGPVEFVMGSPPDEEGRDFDELVEQEHRIRVERMFAIATTEVTVEQFRRFRNNHRYNTHFAPTEDCPVNNVSWYDAAEYCNWLSRQEKLPPDDWCYLTNDQGKFSSGMQLAPDYLQRTGYRLPREAEWEFACRAGAVTSRCFGQSEELLNQYAWYIPGPRQRWMIPVGQLKPNDLGLFDVLGNAWERCEGPFDDFGNLTIDDRDHALIDDNETHAMRGGSIFHASRIRSADRQMDGPTHGHYYIGFRPVRTLRSDDP